MGKGIYYFFSVLCSFVVIVLLMRFFGMTTADIADFIKYGIGGALEIVKELRNSILQGSL